jgi:hypothetical protein
LGEVKAEGEWGCGDDETEKAIVGSPFLWLLSAVADGFWVAIRARSPVQGVV